MRFASMIVGSALIASSVLCATALAEPLVKMDGNTAKPGVVTAWSSSGTRVELTVRNGADPQAVASAIEGGVEKVKAKVTAGKVVVIGKPEAELLPALAQVDFGGGDELGALAQNAGNSGDSDSGSSLRAKKTVDVAALFKDQAITAQGTVSEVTPGKFPETEVTIYILRGPTGELGKDVHKGKKIKFKPVFKLRNKQVDWADEANQLNIGAWYLQKNDKVFVKIGRGADGSYEATILSRS